MKQRYWLVFGVSGLLICLAVLAQAVNFGPTIESPGTHAAVPAAALLLQGAKILPSAAAAKDYDEKADATKDITAMLAKARLDNKYVLLDFGANWCPDCIVLSKIFDDGAVKPFLDANFHVVKIDVGRFDRNLDLAKKFGNPIGKGIPAVIVLDSSERIIASTGGGELESARTMTVQDILTYLKKWAPKKPD